MSNQATAYLLVLGRALLFILALGAGMRLESAEATPVVSLKEGLASENPLLRPGKVDFLFRHPEGVRQYNLFGWSSVFKGGGGILDIDGADSTKYLGGFVRPLAPWPQRGDLILGAHWVDAPVGTDYEFQGEYRCPFGVGIGGGFVERDNSPNDVTFGKVTFRKKRGQWNYILELQGQEVGNETSPGGYAALYDEQWMGVFGHDGEQWRATFGYIARETQNLFRPCAELIYVDNSIGEINGPRSWFGNVTLGYKGGFLSHPARLGRAMGPQGLEFGNPLGFLVPTWNRRLETWELGGLIDLRLEVIRFPNHTYFERYEGLFFPFQFVEAKNMLDYLFVGGSYSRDATDNSPGLLGGLIGKVGFLQVAAGLEYQFRRNETLLVVGLIDWF